MDYIHRNDDLHLLPGNLSSLALQSTGISVHHHLWPFVSTHLSGMLRTPPYCAIVALTGEEEKSW